MEFQDVVRRRRMVRAFTGEPIEAATRDRILANAVRAPSAGFSQGWAFLVCESEADRDRFWAATGGVGATPSRWLAGMRTAPLIVIPMSCRRAYLDRYAEPDKGWTDRDEARWLAPYWHVDTGMAALLMLLTATDAALGACLFGIPVERVAAFRAEFGVPDDHDPIGAVAIGHPAPDSPSPSLARGRRPLGDVVHLGGWGRAWGAAEGSTR